MQPNIGKTRIYARMFKRSRELYSMYLLHTTKGITLWTIHNGVFGAPNVCNGAPIDEITLSPFIAQKGLLFCNFQAISVIGKLHGCVTFINLNIVLLSL